LHLPQAKLADNEAKHTRFSERLAHERSKRGEYDKELKQVEEEYAKAEKALDAASRKAEAAAAAMKELEQRDVKVRRVARMNHKPLSQVAQVACE
jgi:chromosome segregation ATPase